MKSTKSIPETTTLSAATSSDSATVSSDTDDIDDITVTRVFGRYMSVDTKQLLKKDAILKKKKKLKTETWKNGKQIKKHYIPMSLLKPQPPSLVDDEVEVDIIMPTNNKNEQRTSKMADAMQNSNDNDDMNLDAVSLYSGEDVLTTKELIDDMARIMKNGAEIRRNQMKHKSKFIKKGHGACFTGADSYFHYNDAETMRQIISYKIDLNLRFKTHSNNGLILWSGRHSAQEEDDYLLLGIENG